MSASRPRQTRKYTAAVTAAHAAQISTNGSQEELYACLQAADYYWDADAAQWLHAARADANPPTNLLRVRVWTRREWVEDEADEIVDRMTDHPGLRLIERSQAYPCRPPNQGEARIYLLFDGLETGTRTPARSASTLR